MSDRDTILQAAANGNAPALEFLRAFARRAHWVDDIADGEKLEVTPETLAKMEGEWLVCLAGNTFFSAYRSQLVPAMVLALNAWADSNDPAYCRGVRLPSEAERTKQIVADVVKGQWHEVVWLVAWLTGGWEKMRATSREFREYDLEEQNGMPG